MIVGPIDSIDWLVVLMLCLIFFLAGTIKGTLGIGLPTASVTMMALFLPPKMALALVVFPILTTNFRQFYRSKNHKEVTTRFRLMAVVLFISLGMTTFFTARLESDQIRMVIGSAICIFCVTSWSFPYFELPEKLDAIFQMIFGFLSGVMGGLTSIWAPPLVIYLIGKKVDRETFIATSGFLFSVGSFPLLIGFILNGMMTYELGLLSIFCIIPTFFGYIMGESLREKLSAELFRKAVIFVFFAAGLRLIWLE